MRQDVASAAERHDWRAPGGSTAGPQTALGQSARHRALLVGGGDQMVREFLRCHLRGLSFEVHELDEGVAAVERMRRDSFDLVVVDEALSDVDGLAVCRAIRAHGCNATTPIVLLLSTRSVSGIVLGLESGADHCIDRMADPRELAARLRAVMRRTMPADDVVSGRRRLCLCGMTIDPERRTALVRGVDVDLTVQEFELLYLLASRPGIVFGRAALLSRLWPRDSSVTDRAIDTAISRLRGKIEQTDTPPLLLTVWGIGYKFTTR